MVSTRAHPHDYPSAPQAAGTTMAPGMREISLMPAGTKLDHLRQFMSNIPHIMLPIIEHFCMGYSSTAADGSVRRGLWWEDYNILRDGMLANCGFKLPRWTPGHTPPPKALVDSGILQWMRVKCQNRVTPAPTQRHGRNEYNRHIFNESNGDYSYYTPRSNHPLPPFCRNNHLNKEVEFFACHTWEESPHTNKRLAQHEHHGEGGDYELNTSRFAYPYGPPNDRNNTPNPGSRKHEPLLRLCTDCADHEWFRWNVAYNDHGRVLPHCRGCTHDPSISGSFAANGLPKKGHRRCMCATAWKSGVDANGRVRGRGRWAKWHLCARCRFQHQKEAAFRIDRNIRKLQRAGLIKKRVDPENYMTPGSLKYHEFSFDWPGLGSGHNRSCCTCAKEDEDWGADFSRIKASWDEMTPREREVQVFRRCLICFLPCFMGDVGQTIGMARGPHDPHNKPECLW